MKTRHLSRSAFTILEVLVSAAIGVLLLGALYVTFDIQINHAQVARDVVEQATLARALLTRISHDVAPSVAPPDPSRYRTSSGAAAGSSGTGGGTTTGGNFSGTASTTGTTGTTGTAQTTPATSGGTTTSNTGAATSTVSSTFTFTVVGDANQLSIFINRVPRGIAPQAGDGGDVVTTTNTSDLRRITYWLAGNAGLARREITAVTSDDATAEVDTLDADSSILAEEVKDISFKYFDGTTWQDSWDGTTTGDDGQTPIGPPLLIAVTLELPDLVKGGTIDDGPTKRYRHVIALPTANGSTQQTTDGEQP